jgi:hypothetical protein
MPWPACQRHPQPLIRPGLTSPLPILIERFRPLGPPSDPSDPLGPPFEPLGPPRTPPRPILIERLRPPRTPVVVRFPSSAGPAWSVRSLPLCRSHSLSRLSALARPRASALGHRSNLGYRFLIQWLDSPDTPSRGCFA